MQLQSSRNLALSPTKVFVNEAYVHCVEGLPEAAVTLSSASRSIKCDYCDWCSSWCLPCLACLWVYSEASNCQRCFKSCCAAPFLAAGVACMCLETSFTRLPHQLLQRVVCNMPTLLEPCPSCSHRVPDNVNTVLVLASTTCMRFAITRSQTAPTRFSTLHLIVPECTGW